MPSPKVTWPGSQAAPLTLVTSIVPKACRDFRAVSQLTRNGKHSELRLYGARRQQWCCRAERRESKGVESVESDVEDQLYPSPFTEAFLRSFVLGVGFGALFEVLHVGSQFVGVLSEVGWQSLATSLVQRAYLFSPNYAADHAGALGSWFFLYAVEALAVSLALDRMRDLDPLNAAKELSKLVTVPKRMLPARMLLFKQMLRWASDLPEAVTATVTASPRPVHPNIRSSGTLAPPRPRIQPPTHPKQDQEEKPRDPPTRSMPEEEDPLAPAEPLTGLVDQRSKKGLAPGQWDVSSSQYGRRKTDLEQRKMFLKNFWYAAGISDQVKDKPVGVEILGEKLVLYRDSKGVVHCLSDVCPHRGAPLHKGWVGEVQGHDCVVCPYHGWAFDEAGQLRAVPAAESDGEWPRKQVLDAFPVQEKGGFIWLFWGSKTLPADERPPIPFVPELEDPNWRPVYGSIEFDCPHWGVFENAIDMAHIHYLHSGTFGNQEQPEIRHMTCSSDAYGAYASFSLHNKPVNALWNFSQVSQVDVTAKALLPSTSVISFTLGRGLSFTTFVNTVPIDANRSINRFALIRRLDVDPIGAAVFNSSAWDSIARQAMLKILTEDKAMVEMLRPEALPLEVSVKADQVQMAFRKQRAFYVAMGYGVPPEAASARFRDL
ncbi:hypothetical protein WJX73_000092 [Symbiochloris irregularis]|uniref:Rieske domain-containing protein n=1 Tax=Symbiochloris irregularis TaxID=706552 RepID=A0AAW1NRE1_9CHLO